MKIRYYKHKCKKINGNFFVREDRKSMAQYIPTFKIKHVGVNTLDDDSAQALAGQLSDLFSLPKGHESETHIFVGSLFEVMKHTKIGKNGHIALETENVEEAMQYLAGKGISFRENTIRRDTDGHIIFVYFEQEIGGFAIHLTK